LHSIIHGSSPCTNGGLCRYLSGAEEISVKDIPELAIQKPKGATDWWCTPVRYGVSIIGKTYLLIRRYVWIKRALKLVDKKLKI